MLTSPTTFSASIIVATALTLGGCFSPEFGEGGFQCDPLEGVDACPANYRCVRQPEDNFVCSTEEPSVKLSLLNPKGVARGGTLAFRLTTFAFEVREDLVGEAAIEGMGHAHVFVDNDEAGWKTVVREGDGVIDIDQAPGSHELVALLVQNNHTPLSPRVETRVPFTIKARP